MPDKLGWQISHKTWGLYRSSWHTDTAKVLVLENANPLLYYLHRALIRRSVKLKIPTSRRGW